MKNLIPKRVMEYIIITFAVVLMDVGIYVFKFPNNFSFAGDRVYCSWPGFWSEDGLCYGCFFFASECV